MAAPYLTKAQTLPEKSSTSLDKLAGFMKHLRMQETLKPTGRLSKTFWGILLCILEEFPDNISFKIRFVSKICLNNLTFYLGQHEEIRAQTLIYSVGRAILRSVMLFLSTQLRSEKWPECTHWEHVGLSP